MSRIWLPGGGGGGDGSDDCTIILSDVPKGLKAVTADSDDEAREGTLDTATTAADSHVLAGETYMKFNLITKHWEKKTGAQTNRGAWTGRIGVNGKIAIPAGNHNGAGFVDQTITDRGAWNGSVGMNGSATVPEGYHSGGGKVNGPAVTQRGAWATNIGINGRAAIPEGYHNGSGYVSQSIPTQGRNYLNPATYNQVICASGRYASGDQGLYGDPNFIEANIMKGKTIFGKVGTGQGFADERVWFFKNGTWSNLITPGLENCPIEVYNGISCICVRQNDVDYPRLNQTVDLTGRNYLKAKIAGRSSGLREDAYLGISTNPNIYNNAEAANLLSAKIQLSPSSGFVNPILDIRSFSGPYFIYIIPRGAKEIGTSHSSQGIVNVAEIYLDTV